MQTPTRSPQGRAARVACYALVAAVLRNAERLHRAAGHLHHADGAEAARWYGVVQTRTNGNGRRTIRALRILVEAVK